MVDASNERRVADIIPQRTRSTSCYKGQNYQISFTFFSFYYERFIELLNTRIRGNLLGYTCSHYRKPTKRKEQVSYLGYASKI